MEIVVPFIIDQPAAAPHKTVQGIKDGIILGKWLGWEPNPEVEQITHNVEGIQLSLQFAKEAEQQSEIESFRGRQMGISYKDGTHGPDCALIQSKKSTRRRNHRLCSGLNEYQETLMASIHSVEISWEDLLGAFTSGHLDKAYYLDRLTGEIFFVPSTSDNNEVRQQLENNGERFLEIPPFDYRSERQIVSEFVADISDPELRVLLHNSLTGRKPFGKIEDILSFYPHEEDRFALLKDKFLSNRLKSWMEENNLFTADTLANFTKHA
jgi:hypothetical protein